MFLMVHGRSISEIKLYDKIKIQYDDVYEYEL
jgi:hypothetical protein